MTQAYLKINTFSTMTNISHSLWITNTTTHKIIKIRHFMIKDLNTTMGNSTIIRDTTKVCFMDQAIKNTVIITCAEVEIEDAATIIKTGMAKIEITITEDMETVVVIKTLDITEAAEIIETTTKVAIIIKAPSELNKKILTFNFIRTAWITKRVTFRFTIEETEEVEVAMITMAAIIKTFMTVATKTTTNQVSTQTPTSTTMEENIKWVTRSLHSTIRITNKMKTILKFNEG